MADTAREVLTQKLATGVASRAVRLAYGDVQTIDGVDPIPVAFVSYGFGASEGSPGLAEGGGAGGVAIPLGAYISGPHGLRFQPNTIAILAMAIPVISTVGWAISRIVRASAN